MAVKYFNFYQGNKIHLGAANEERAVDITALGCGCPRTMRALMQGGAEAERRVEDFLLAAQTPALVMEKVRFAPVVESPEKILCIGLNYAAHSEETKMKLPDYPELFSKFASALHAAGAAICLPRDAVQFDYEAELVIVMGRQAYQVPKEQAREYIFGYTAGNDFSARDLQMRTPQWLLGKTPDGFAPAGPYIVPEHELDTSDLHIQSFVNGELRQDDTTANMIFDCSTLVSYISQYITLQPGDLIYTGTPKGVILGYPEEQRVWLKAGDTVCVRIEGIGELTNRLVGGSVG